MTTLPVFVYQEIYPAHAGINPRNVKDEDSNKHLPRTRGDKPLELGHFRDRSRSTPHTRG